MSDSTRGDQRSSGARPATERTVEVASETAQPAESGLSRARGRLSEAASSVGNKVSELRPSSDREDRVIGASTGAGAASAAAVGSGAGVATNTVTRRTRKARLRLARLDPWSVFKTALLFAVAGAIIFFIATWVVWGVINASGVFASVNNAVNDLVASPTSTTKFRLEDYVNTHRVLGLTALVGAIDAILFTALATLFSFLYNLAASVMGGLEVTLAED